MNRKEQIAFLKYCFRKRNDSRFVKNVMDVSGDYSLVNMEEFGGSEVSGCIYHIKMEPSYSGFFADHNRLLSLLYYADYYGMKPVVEYGDQYSYREDHPVNGTENPFEYYFEQPCGISAEELGKYKSVLRSRKENAALAGRLNAGTVSGGYGMTEAYITALGEISRKYIRLNKTVAPMIEESLKQIIQDEPVLGVHIRGTDFKKNYNGHPVCIEAEEYLKEALRLLKDRNAGYGRVFLATDDAGALRLFQDDLGDKLAYYKDVVRSDESETVMKSKSGRENHHYMLGYEVLRDMLTLAACKGLVAGMSQVSYSARIQKKSCGQEYSDLVILNRGVNYHRRENCPI